MPKAVKVTPQNATAFIELGRQVKMDLSYLSDEVEYYAEDGMELYLITDGAESTNNRTFTTMSGGGFRQSWKFVPAEITNTFVQIERV